jgi:hypothetical protein
VGGGEPLAPGVGGDEALTVGVEVGSELSDAETDGEALDVDVGAGVDLLGVDVGSTETILNSWSGYSTNTPPDASRHRPVNR